MNKVEKILDNLILSKFIQRDELKKGITNSGWLFLDKLIRIFFGFVVNIQITRYLGPEQYGVWSYILAFLALFTPISTLGLEGIVVRELIKNPAPKYKILGSTYVLRLIGSLLSALLASMIFIIQNIDNEIFILYFFINISLFLFSPLEVLDYFYTSLGKSKYTVFAKTSVFVLLNGLKVYFLIQEYPLIWFISIHVVDIVLGLIISFGIYSSRFDSALKWQIDRQLMIVFLKESWILMFAGVVTILYMKIDQVMIHNMLNDKELGFYSSALRISEMWYFLPVIIVNSMMPALVNAFNRDKELYLSKLQRILDLFVWLSIVLGVLLSLCSNFIINLLFGAAFSPAAAILSLHIWSSLFVFVGVAYSSAMVIQGLSKYSLYCTATGAVSNVLLNLIFIPIYGALGAAFATLISYFIASIFCHFFIKETFFLNKLLLNSFQFNRIYKSIMNEGFSFKNNP